VRKNLFEESPASVVVAIASINNPSQSLVKRQIHDKSAKEPKRRIRESIETKRDLVSSRKSDLIVSCFECRRIRPSGIASNYPDPPIGLALVECHPEYKDNELDTGP
jgi:hypothetical protein